MNFCEVINIYIFTGDNNNGQILWLLTLQIFIFFFLPMHRYCLSINFIRMTQRRRFALFHPSIFQIVNNNIQYMPNLHCNLHPQHHYGLHSKKIVDIAQRTHKTTNPIYSFYQTRKLKANTPYFDVDKEELQQIVNRLNIQTRLSKSQLNEQQTNGYRKIKASLSLPLLLINKGKCVCVFFFFV